jgi:hypothetical protein
MHHRNRPLFTLVDFASGFDGRECQLPPVLIAMSRRVIKFHFLNHFLKEHF